MGLGWLKIVLLAAFGLGLAANDYTADYVPSLKQGK